QCSKRSAQNFHSPIPPHPPDLERSATLSPAHNHKTVCTRPPWLYVDADGRFAHKKAPHLPKKIQPTIPDYGHVASRHKLTLFFVNVSTVFKTLISSKLAHL